MGKPIPVFSDPQVLIDYVSYHGRITKRMRAYFGVTVRFEGSLCAVEIDVYTRAVICSRVTKLVMGLLPYCHTTSVCTFMLELVGRYRHFVAAETARLLFAALFWAIEFEDELCEGAVCKFYSQFELHLSAPCFVPLQGRTGSEVCVIRCSPSLVKGLTARGFKLCDECVLFIASNASAYHEQCAGTGVTKKKAVLCTYASYVMFGEFVNTDPMLEDGGVYYSHIRDVELQEIVCVYTSVRRGGVQ